MVQTESATVEVRAGLDPLKVPGPQRTPSNKHRQSDCSYLAEELQTLDHPKKHPNQAPRSANPETRTSRPA